jgi:hypothetical protein
VSLAGGTLPRSYFSFLLFTAGSRSKSIFPRIAPFSIVYEKLISPEWRDAATTDDRGQLRLVWVKIHRRGCSVRTSGLPPIADEVVHRCDRLKSAIYGLMHCSEIQVYLATAGAKLFTAHC